jgi:hypothetical protein
VFSSDGHTAMNCDTLSHFVTAISREMVRSQQALEHFTLSDLRRTLETLLADWVSPAIHANTSNPMAWVEYNKDITTATFICVKSGRPCAHGERAEVIYTLIGTAKLNNLNPEG